MYFTSGAEPSSHQTRLPENPESGGKAVSLPGANHPSLRPPPTRSGKLTINDITKFFSLPIAEAASILGVSDSVLKRICRENGIVRWPYRKVG
ncbi:protein RKD4-like [Dendrobium catenatum]|uniref:protein RKD4-like n=1 Tax=Dendrobium catenatum TaxID=906689 RepID=UPI0010A08758|nr:protein RKD4-like [Dendrobium catenatum]